LSIISITEQNPSRLDERYGLISTVTPSRNREHNAVEGRGMKVELTKDELGIINNALNEVCNGIDLEGEFDTRMGCTVEEARELLAKIRTLASGQ
jgi:hypothetical protein